MTKNPWLRIFFSPRETIRAIVDSNPKFRFTVLSGFWGVLSLLGFAQNFSLGDAFPLWGIVAMVLVLSIPIGWISLSISSLFLYWFGKLLGGIAPYFHVRAAAGWSNVPNFPTLLIWLLGVFAYGSFVFTQEFVFSLMAQQGFNPMMGWFLLETVFSIWSFVALIKTLAEVQSFSWLRALVSVVGTTIAFVILLWAGMFIIHEIIHI